LLVLDRASETAWLKHPLAGLEEGGFVKGYALDAALKMALRQGVPSGWVDFGGQILTWGQNLEVSIADADDRQRTRIRLELPSSRSLSSSGCSQRGRHILDPHSGNPCPDWGAVSVVANTGLEAEVLSTALYVLGPEAGLLWAQEQGACAAFLLRGGDVIESPEFKHLGSVLLSGRNA
jgi:thiamine biosynthesis lipoprotein